MGRTLRSERRRARLWRSQDGRCAECGALLGDDWEADHIIPWRLTHRTNIHEMQALCRVCNRKAGGKYVNINWGALRPGQRAAVNAIRERLVRGETHTAISLPCRYGKSNVIRAATLALADEGLICCSLALSPDKDLRDQLTSATKWRDFMTLAEVTMKGSLPLATLDRIKIRPRSNGELFLSTTMQLVQKNVDDFAEWVEYETHLSGLPVLIFVDECHTGSEDNQWGDATMRLAEVGARVVLLTATPERADGKRIPGFSWTEVTEEEEVRAWRTKPGSRPELVRVEVLEGVSRRLQLVPDVSVSWREAWDDGILCKISHTPFDVKLDFISDLETQDKWLSALSPSKTKSVLGHVARQDTVIEEGTRRLVTELGRKRSYLDDAAAIVYCGNDQDRGDPNKEAKRIRKAILRHDPKLVILIATTSEGSDDEAVAQFQQGRGDVLIVKQMASLGIDIPRLKVGLDLSPTRTWPALIQRMMRPATPHGEALVMTWISPADVITAEYFRKLVAEQGGEAVATDMTVVDQYEKERDADADKISVLVTDVQGSDFTDSEANTAARDAWSEVEQMLTLFPALGNYYSHAEIADRLTAPPADEPEIRDSRIAADTLRSEIGTIIKQAVEIYLRRHSMSRQNYSAVIEELWATVKKDADWPAGAELSSLDDLALLQRVRDAAEAMVRRISG
jgi:superfamily II DNA or RNA helicase